MMLYFKTVKIEHTNPEIIEKAIRAFSLKRLTSLPGTALIKPLKRRV
jgi:hypothetical protein